MADNEGAGVVREKIAQDLLRHIVLAFDELADAQPDEVDLDAGAWGNLSILIDAAEMLTGAPRASPRKRPAGGST